MIDTRQIFLPQRSLVRSRLPIATAWTAIILCGTMAGAEGGVPLDPSSAEAPTKESTPAQAIKAKKAELARKLLKAEKALEEATANGTAASAFLQQSLDLLKRIDLIYERQIGELEHELGLAWTRAQLETDLTVLRESGLTEPRPYSFLLIDRFRDELNVVTAKIDTRAATLETATANLQKARDNFDEAERARRQAKEGFETNKDPSRTPDLAARNRVAILSSRLADELVRLRQIELNNEKAASEGIKLRKTFFETKVAILAGQTWFTREDLQTQIVEIEKKEDDANRAMRLAKDNLEYVEGLWANARESLAKVKTPDPVLKEQVEAYRLAREARQAQVTLTTRQLERLSKMKQIWQRRFDVSMRRVNREVLSTWTQEARDALDQLEREERLLTSRLGDLKRDQVTLKTKIASFDQAEESETRVILDEQVKILETMTIDAYEVDLASVYAQKGLEEKLLADIQVMSGATAGDWVMLLWANAQKVWRFEITSVDDQPITVRKVVIGIILLLVGFLLSRYLSSLLGRRLLQRLGVQESAAAGMQSVLFYVLVVLFTLFALRIVNVPLTWFTLLGGAVAIGVGFGSQNIVNNFMSGMILLIERPVKVGDLIQLDDLYGNVVHIGPRSTRIRTGSNLEIIVPNSTFLESNVTNWTLSESTLRAHVAVGVVYGAPVHEVTGLLKRAVAENPKIFKQPEPFVLFTEFGDNSLNFEIHFWIRVQVYTDWLTIKSEVRYAIDRLLRAAGIVIAFPQRDIHLDTARPLDVRMVSESTRAEPVSTDVIEQQKTRAWLLGRIELFGSLRADEVMRLSAMLEAQHFGAGRDVVVQGDPGSSLFVMVDGLLDVKVRSDGQVRKVEQLESGEFFGEMSLLTGEPRSATVTAITETTVFELDRDMLAPILKERPEVARILSEVLAKRRKRTDETLHPSTPTDEEIRSLVSELRRRIHNCFGLDE